MSSDAIGSVTGASISGLCAANLTSGEGFFVTVLVVIIVGVFGGFAGFGATELIKKKIGKRIQMK